MSFLSSVSVKIAQLGAATEEAWKSVNAELTRTPNPITGSPARKQAATPIFSEEQASFLQRAIHRTSAGAVNGLSEVCAAEFQKIDARITAGAAQTIATQQDLEKCISKVAVKSCPT